MAEYNHLDIESRWQQYWRDNEVFKTEINKDKPKYYVLDMFPYPSGAGLHVGHPWLHSKRHILPLQKTTGLQCAPPDGI